MRMCRAALEVRGDVFGCDLDAPHAGIAHHSGEAGAHWCSDGEARAAKNQEQAS